MKNSGGGRIGLSLYNLLDSVLTSGSDFCACGGGVCLGEFRWFRLHLRYHFFKWIFSSPLGKSSQSLELQKHWSGFRVSSGRRSSWQMLPRAGPFGVK